MEQEANKAKGSDAILSPLKDNLPIISIGLLIIGTLNLVVYYQVFGIDILTYLDITEVLQVQFKLFAISLGVLAIVSVHLAFVASFRPSYEEMIEQKIWFQALHSPEQIEAQRAVAQRLLKSTKRKGKILLMLIGSIIIIPCIIKIALFYEDADGISLGWMSICLLASCIDFAYSSFLDSEPEFVNYFNSKPKFVIARQAGLLIFLTYSSVVIGYIQAVKHKGKISSNEVIINMEKAKIATNKEVRYVGKTKNFTFLYDVANRKALIYPNADIKDTAISDGVDYRTAEEKKDKPISYYLNKVKALMH